jgi:hypothetical protein
MQARRHGGTVVWRHGGTEARRHGGTEARRHGGTEAQRHRGTEAQEAQRHRGTEAQRQGGTELAPTVWQIGERRATDRPPPRARLHRARPPLRRIPTEPVSIAHLCK